MCSKIVAVNHTTLAGHMFSVTPVLMEYPQGVYYTAGYGNDCEAWTERHDNRFTKLSEPLSLPGHYRDLCAGKYYGLPVMAVSMFPADATIFSGILPEGACTHNGRNFYIFLNGVFHLTFVPAANAILKSRFTQLRNELVRQNHQQGDCAAWKELLRVASARVKLTCDIKEIEPIIDVGFVECIGTDLSCRNAVEAMSNYLGRIGRAPELVSAVRTVTQQVVQFDQDRARHHTGGVPCSHQK